MAIKAELNEQVEGIEVRLTDLLRRNEYDYSVSYNIYVRNKEKELKSLIDQITARYEDKKLHDKKMHGLE